jgi:hypothetical protein
MSDTVPNYAPQPSGPNIKTALVAGAIVALLAANVYLYLQLDHLRTDVAKMRDGLSSEIASLREASSVTVATSKKHIEDLKSELDSTRQESMQAASTAKKEALTRVDQVAKKITEEQKQQQQQVVSQINDVKQQTTTANAKIGEVSSEVTNVKSSVAATKSELDKTIADLKRTNGDLGVQSGLIATNSKELAALKRLGERNYFEFTIVRSKAPQRVSDILIQVKKTDPKKNRFTMDVIADDKKTEKKDKTINEPVQFYTSRARQPYEIVVNQVQKDTIKGYLSTPKEQIAR